MELSPTRFTTIEGRSVSVAINSTEDARAALKELRHKKRELSLWKRGLAKERQVVRGQQTKGKKPVTFLQNIIQHKKGLLGWLMGFVRYRQALRPLRKLDTLEKQLAQIEELSHKIDDCIVQIEGKLLQTK